jgi:hypothetical protein
VLARCEPAWRALHDDRPHRTGGPHDGIPSEAEAGPQRRVLLFQLATDDVMQWCWGGAGAWYVFVDVGRLAARDFSRVDAWLECHWDADRGDPRESSASPGTGRRTRPASCPTARERARASFPAGTSRGASGELSGSPSSDRTFHGHTDWDTHRHTHFAIPLATGSRTLAKPPRK